MHGLKFNLHINGSKHYTVISFSRLLLIYDLCNHNHSAFNYIPMSSHFPASNTVALTKWPPSSLGWQWEPQLFWVFRHANLKSIYKRNSKVTVSKPEVMLLPPSNLKAFSLFSQWHKVFTTIQSTGAMQYIVSITIVLNFINI